MRLTLDKRTGVFRDEHGRGWFRFEGRWLLTSEWKDGGFTLDGRSMLVGRTHTGVIVGSRSEGAASV